MTAKKLQEQISNVLRSMKAAKPRSRRHIELEVQLRGLRTRQLQMEHRSAKRAA
jgi:hypothetical protein